jgi:GTP-binding protein
MASTSVRHRRNFEPSRLFATVNQPTDGNNHHSARKRFKEIPVHPSILEYIRSIGVGIPPRASKRKQPHLALLNDARRSRGRTSASARTNRIQRMDQTVSSSLSKSKNVESSKSNQRQPQQHNAAGVWMPPPPFGPNSMPVQMIASVGPESVRDEDDKSSSAAMKVDRGAYPQNESLIAEIALAGRSNVGKSTLLNALLYGNRHGSFGSSSSSNSMEPPLRQRQGRRGRVPPPVKLPKGVKATMSSKPGETRRITFYKLQHVTPIASRTSASSHNTHSNLDNTGNQMVERRRLLLVDLPGYGFAYAKEHQAAAYRALWTDYLWHRGPALQRILLLIDARHGLKRADLEFLHQLQQQQPHPRPAASRQPLPPIQLVLTKCDLVPQADLARRVAQVRQELSDVLVREPSQLPIMLVSARPGVGYDNVDRHTQRAMGGILELQKELAALAVPQRGNQVASSTTVKAKKKSN